MAKEWLVMPRTVNAALILIGVLAVTSDSVAAERAARISTEAFACSSWGAWREYGQASLTARGARPSNACPLRLAVGTKVVVVDEDAGAGSSEIRYRGKNWFVDNQRLD